ncbi:MAG: (2Fe-2S)-binding protein [Asticcacaulis sp.]|nr:(2Fe-2S)-binding protein [Asticcacaulis sp.]
MYICNCNAIRERDVNIAISNGASTPKQVFDHAGCRPQCAKCVCEMRELIDDAQTAFRLAAE